MKNIIVFLICAMFLIGCTAPGAEGSQCGGVQGFACNPGLKCIVSDPQISDAFGTCTKPVSTPSNASKLAR